MAPSFTPRTQLYVHVYRDGIGEPVKVARFEGIGPVLLDHIAPYTKGVKGQTRPSNIAPQGRGLHRCRTTGGGHFDTIWPGVHPWISAAGQSALVDQTGTHPLPLRR